MISSKDRFLSTVSALCFLVGCAGAYAQQPADVFAGTIREINPTSFQMKLQAADGSQTSYSFTKNTAFVDGEGKPINNELIFSGQATTVHCTTEDGRIVVDKVVCNHYQCPIFQKKHRPCSY